MIFIGSLVVMREVKLSNNLSKLIWNIVEGGATTSTLEVADEDSTHL